MSVCPNCMANNPDGIAYCPHCGAAQSEKPAWQSEPVVVTQPEPVVVTAPETPVWQSNPDPKPEQVAPIAWQDPVQSGDRVVPQEPVSPVPWQTPQSQTPVYTDHVPGQPTQVPRSARILSIISMACGIASLAFFWAGMGAVMLGIAALVLRGIATKKGAQSNGMLRAGLITGIFGIILGAIFMVVGGLIDLFSFVEYATEDPFDYDYYMY